MHEELRDRQTERDPCGRFISLIIATIDREAALRRLLESLRQQTFRNFDVIIADQNADDWLSPMLDEFRSELAIHHLRTPRGLSKSRNLALQIVRSPVVGFPDDDSWYAPDLLESVSARFAQDQKLVGLSGRCIDATGRHAAGGNSRRAGQITARNAWRKGVSATLFVRSEIAQLAGGFDEELGLGSGTPFQSGEETDLVLRLVQHGCKIVYAPDLTVFHPPLPSPAASGALERAWFYGLGMGRVLQKHHASYVGIAPHIAGPLVGALIAFVKGDVALARLRMVRAMGRLRGWRSAEISPNLPAPAWIPGLKLIGQRHQSVESSSGTGLRDDDPAKSSAASHSSRRPCSSPTEGRA